jgi:hypothetical protein
LRADSQRCALQAAKNRLSVTPFAPPVQNSKVEHFVIFHFPNLEGWGTDRRKKNSFRQEVTGHKRCFKQRNFADQLF